MVGAADGHAANWAFEARLTPSRVMSVPRGKVMGGSSTVNGGVFVRATAGDFDAWAALGNDQWSFAKVLPFLRRLEDDLDFPGSEYHGNGGPMPVSRVADARLHPLSQAFATAVRDLGFPTNSTRTRLAHRDAAACRATSSTACESTPRSPTSSPIGTGPT